MKPMTDDYLSEVIANQSLFSNMPPAALYDELNSIRDFRGFDLVEDIGDLDKVLRSANFQYLVKGNNVQIINKYFKD